MNVTDPELWLPGRLPYELCQHFVEEIVLVSDEEIQAAVTTLYRSGLVVEPSGSAAFAAIVNNKIPELEGKNVVCILSGGNIGKDELANFPDWQDVCQLFFTWLILTSLSQCFAAEKKSNRMINWVYAASLCLHLKWHFSSKSIHIQFQWKVSFLKCMEI